MDRREKVGGYRIILTKNRIEEKRSMTVRKNLREK